jgi:hypothetical protein
MNRIFFAAGQRSRQAGLPHQRKVAPAEFTLFAGAQLASTELLFIVRELLLFVGFCLPEEL